MSDSKKYYLALIYNREMRNDLHCTHCYFGTLNRKDLQTVVDEVAYFFEHFTNFKLEKINFSIPAMFGPDNDIRVLLAEDPTKLASLQGLRNRFQHIGLLTQSARPFRPHVTTPTLGRISEWFTHYALCSSGEVLYRWAISPAETEGDVAV